MVEEGTVSEKKTQHVIHHPDGGWSVKKGGATKATKVFETEEAAISYARKISINQNAELYVHRPDGTILEKDSYGKDPLPPKDQR
jgi:hypothetical protein